MNLHIFPKQAARLKHIHSFMREVFQRPCPSLEINDSFYVLSAEAPRERPAASFPVNIDFAEGDVITLFSRVSFSSRGKDNFVEKLSPAEALAKFMERCGLGVAETDGYREAPAARFMGRVAEKKFDVMNAFEVTGSFEVKDPGALSKAIREGVGARRSYGFGLVLVRSGG